MKYIIYLGYNGNYYGAEYNQCGKRYAHETSREKAKRYDTEKQAQNAIKHSICKCVNIDKACELKVEEVDE